MGLEQDKEGREGAATDAVARAVALAATLRDRDPSSLIPALVTTVKDISTRLAREEQLSPAALEPILTEAAKRDKDDIVAVLSGLIAVQLIDRQQASDETTDAGKRLSPDLVLGITKRIAAETIGEDSYLQQLGRWLAAGARAWSSEFYPLELRNLLERVLRLVAVHGAEAVVGSVHLLSAPFRNDEDLEALLGQGRRRQTAEARDNVADDALVVLSSAHFQSLREALYKNNFRKVEGSPWPTAPLERSNAKSYAQLRPAAMDLGSLMAPKTIEAWATTMWRQQSELSDLDADALDALCAIYLSQARGPDDTAVADVDEILAMRGLKPKRAGSGRRGGYEPEQRADMLKALSHIQNVWINVAEVMVYEREVNGQKPRAPVAKTLQSRPFIITDRMGQIRLDGYIEVERFIFRPGKAFAAFLFGTGQETGLLFKKALQYDPFRRKWEKRITRYMSWHWRAASLSGEFNQTYTVRTLLDAVGESVNERYPSKTRARLEQALDQLAIDKVLVSWRYVDWREEETSSRGWTEKWLDAGIAIEAPQVIRDYYLRTRGQKQSRAIERGVRSDPADLAERLKRLRKTLGLSQQEAAARLGIQQGHVSKLERGKATPSPQLREVIETWLSEVA